MAQSLAVPYFLLIVGQLCIAFNVIVGKSLIGYLPIFLFLFLRFFSSTIFSMAMSAKVPLFKDGLGRYHQFISTRDSCAHGVAVF